MSVFAAQAQRYRYHKHSDHSADYHSGPVGLGTGFLGGALVTDGALAWALRDIHFLEAIFSLHPGLAAVALLCA